MMKGIDMKKVKELRGELLLMLWNIVFCLYLILDNDIMAGMGGLLATYYVYRKIKKAFRSDGTPPSSGWVCFCCSSFSLATKLSMMFWSFGSEELNGQYSSLCLPSSDS